MTPGNPALNVGRCSQCRIFLHARAYEKDMAEGTSAYIEHPKQAARGVAVPHLALITPHPWSARGQA